MKLKQLMCAFFACAILFSACKKDDETSNDDVVGTWNAVSYTSSDCDDPDDDGTVDASLLACNDPAALLCTEISYVLKADGTFDNEIVAIVLGIDASETLTGTYTTSGDEVELCTTGVSDCFTVTVANNQFTLTTTDDPDTGCDVDTVFEKQ